MSDAIVAALIGAEEGNSSGMNLERDYQVYKKVTPGQVVRLLSNGKIDNLPLGQFGVGTYQVLKERQSSSYNTMSVQLDENRVLVVTTLFTAFVLTVNGDSITVGPESGMSGTPNTLLKVLKLDPDRAAIFHRTASNTPAITIIKTNIDAVTFGETESLSTTVINGASYSDATIVNVNKGIAFYYDVSSPNYTKAVAFSVNDTAVSPGTEFTVASHNGTMYHKIIEIGLDKAVVTYVYYNGTNYYQYLGVITVSDHSLTFGPLLQWYGQNVSTFLKKIDTDKFLVGHTSGYSSVTIYYCTVSGTTITQLSGKAVTSSIASSANILCAELSTSEPTKKYLFGIKANNGNYYTGTVYTVDTLSTTTNATSVGTSVTIGSLNNNTYPIATLTGYETDKALFFYKDLSLGENTLKAQVLTADGTTLSVMNSSYYNDGHTGFMRESLLIAPGKILAMALDDDVPAPVSYELRASVVTPSETASLSDKLLGIAQTQNKVLLKGLSHSHIGLTPAQPYNYNRQGELTTVTGTSLGVSLSDTEVLLKDYLF